MHVLVIGAAGMIGRKLVDRLIRENALNKKPIDRLTAADIVAPPELKAPFPIARVTADLADPGVAEKLVADAPDVVFHLSALPSAGAEADFALGYRTNFDASRALFDAIRVKGGGYRPRVVFTSTIAVFGAPFPPIIEDTFFTTPLTSYGAQKAMAELLLADYTRRGFLDGIGIRLPTICIRPGVPNKAASGFFSSILREPLIGLEAILPVEDSVRHWHASPRAAVGFLIHAAGLASAQLGDRRNLTMPGLSVTVGEQIKALRRVAGDRAVKLIRREPDAGIAKIVAGWPGNFTVERALALGFKADANFDAIIAAHIEDELGGKLP